MPQQFWKYHGLGNDFILLDRRRPSPNLPEISSAWTQSVCDRHTGIGADGVLVLRSASGGAVIMDVHNADGSRSAMCGNGLRCVAHHVFLQGHHGDTVTIETSSGRYPCRRVAPDHYAVAMGKPSRVHPEI